MIILKILLWLLLSLLFLIFLVLVLLLAVPFRYRIRAAKLPAERSGLLEAAGEKLKDRFPGTEENEPAAGLPLPFEAEVSASFLAKIFQLQLGYVKEGYFRFLIFGKEADGGNPAKKGKKHGRKAEKGAEAGPAAERPEEEAPKASESAAQQAAPQNEVLTASPEEALPEAEAEDEARSKGKKKRKGKKPGEKKDREALSEKTGRLLDKIDELLDKADYYLDLLADNAEGIRQLLDCLFRVLKKLFPRKGDMQLAFGLADPYDTGRVLAVWSVLEPALVTEDRQLQVEADFEKKRLEADGWMEGHFSLGGLAAPLVGALLHKSVRKLIRTVLKLSGRGKQKNEKNAAEEAA